MKITEEEWFDLEHFNGVFDDSLCVVNLRMEYRTRREPATVEILPCQATAMAESSRVCSPTLHYAEKNMFGRLAPAVDDSLHVQHGDYLEDDPSARILRRDVRAHEIVHETLHDPRRVCLARVHPCCEKHELPPHHRNRVVHGRGRCDGYEGNAVSPGDGDSKRIHSKEDFRVALRL